MAGFFCADEEEVALLEGGFEAAQGEGYTVGGSGGGALGDLGLLAGGVAGEELGVGALEKVCGPDGVLVFVGAGVGGDLLAVEEGLPGFAFKAGVAEDEVAEELAGVVVGLTGEVDAEALDVGVEGFRAYGDGGLGSGEGGKEERE